MKDRGLQIRFAITGVAIGFACVAAYYFVYKFNPFGLPTLGNENLIHPYEAPWGYKLFQAMLFILCPGQIIHAVFLGAPDPLAWFIWAIGALFNAPIYFLYGYIYKLIRRGPTP